jgi:type IX secretion system PorP/SprF family membrane protein
MKKVVAFLFSLALLHASADAQNFDLYNNYFANPYLINPAEAATDYPLMFADYRKQWLGFNGAPAISTFTYTSRFNESRAGVGAKISSVTAGLLTTTDALLTYAYGIGLNDHHTLTFALSAGATSNQLDISKIDTSDPAVQKFLDNSLNPTANFGMLFRCKSGVNVGVTLPELFKRNYQYPSEANHENAPMPTDEIIFSAYFSRNIQSGLVNKRKNGFVKKVKADTRKAPLEFFVLYRYRENEPAQAEGLVKINFSERVALGAGYRQWLGPMASMHFDFDKLLLSYAYEPFNKLAEFTTSSHQIQLGLRVGKRKADLKKKAPILKSTLRNKKEEHIARFQQENEDDLLQTESPVMKRHYVVVKSFREFEQADLFKEKLITQKFNGNVIYNERDQLYHVYIYNSTKSSEAHAEARNVRSFTKLKQAKVITIEEKK